MLSEIIDADGIQRSGVLIGNTLHVCIENGKQIGNIIDAEKYAVVNISNWEMK